MDELLAPSYEGVGVCIPMGVPMVFGVFDDCVLSSEPFEFVLRSNADIEFSFLPSVVRDDECSDGGTKELGVAGA